MNPRGRSELVRRRLESGPSCVDECAVYVALKKEFERIREQWDRTRMVVLFVVADDDKVVKLCEIDSWGRSWSSVHEDAKLAMFTVIKNTGAHLRNPTVFPDLVADPWTPPWWGEVGKPSWMHARREIDLPW